MRLWLCLSRWQGSHSFPLGQAITKCYFSSQGYPCTWNLCQLNKISQVWNKLSCCFAVPQEPISAVVMEAEVPLKPDIQGWWGLRGGKITSILSFMQLSSSLVQIRAKHVPEMRQQDVKLCDGAAAACIQGVCLLYLLLSWYLTNAVCFP